MVPDEQSAEVYWLAHSISDVCRLTSLARTSVYEAIKRGKLKARKLGRRTVVLDEDLRAFLAAAPVLHGETA